MVERHEAKVARWVEEEILLWHEEQVLSDAEIEAALAIEEEVAAERRDAMAANAFLPENPHQRVDILDAVVGPSQKLDSLHDQRRLGSRGSSSLSHWVASGEMQLTVVDVGWCPPSAPPPAPRAPPTAPFPVGEHAWVLTFFTDNVCNQSNVVIDTDRRDPRTGLNAPIECPVAVRASQSNPCHDSSMLLPLLTRSRAR